jgi:hypothetical protein
VTSRVALRFSFGSDRTRPVGRAACTLLGGAVNCSGSAMLKILERAKAWKKQKV